MYSHLTNVTIGNLRAYISERFCPDGYGCRDDDFQTFEDKAAFIYKIFLREKWYGSIPELYLGNKLVAFCDWCAGLPPVLNTDYYVYRTAAEDLKRIVGQSDRRLLCGVTNETTAERRLSSLIYDMIAMAYDESDTREVT